MFGCTLYHIYVWIMYIFICNTTITSADGFHVLVPVGSAFWKKAHILVQPKVNFWFDKPIPIV